MLQQHRVPGLGSMNAKIARFSRLISRLFALVAEDEEETLRGWPLSLRYDDFIAGGRWQSSTPRVTRCFAEFPSRSEAVRCAIDIQESLRTRNMAYPPSRQMSFRIGITIATWSSATAICSATASISRRAWRASPKSAASASRARCTNRSQQIVGGSSPISRQEVKNIPTPVHAFMVAMRREDGTYATPQVRKRR